LPSDLPGPIHQKILDDSRVGATYHITSHLKNFGEDEEEILETPNSESPNEVDARTKKK